jgi:hypothetical protein
MTITRDDGECRTAELDLGIRVEQAKHGRWQPARVVIPTTQPLSVAEAMAFADVVSAAAQIAARYLPRNAEVIWGARVSQADRPCGGRC